MNFKKALFIILICFGLMLINNYSFAVINDINDNIELSTSSSGSTYGDYTYTTIKNYIIITSYSGDEEEITIPDKIGSVTVKGLYSECFATAYNLKKVNIPSSITAIYTDTFLNCRTLETIEVASGNTSYSSYDGVLYSNDYKYLVSCPEGRKGNVTVRSGTLYICDYSFYLASKVTSISIPASVIDIGDFALYGTSSLSNIDINSNNTEFIYSDGLLYGLNKHLSTSSENYTTKNNKKELIKCVDTRMSCVTIDSDVKLIRDYAFYQCNELLGPINIPSGVERIGEYAFFNCNNLTGEITIPSSVTEIGICAFYGCNNITQLTIDASIEKIPDDCFAYCTSLKEIVIPNGIKEIGERAFFYCSSVESLTLNYGLTKIDDWAFDYLISLKGDLVIPNSVTSIGTAAFDSCESIDGYIIVGSGVLQIGDSAFYSSENAKGIIFKGSVPAVSEYVFVRPNVTYYYLKDKIGFEDIIIDKDLRTYSEKPVVTFVIGNTEYKKVEQSKYGLTVDAFEVEDTNDYVFKGWYYDDKFTQEYSFDDIIMDDTTIYACVEEKNSIEFNDDENLIESGTKKNLDFQYVLETGASEEDIVWESSNSDIATVENGVVTGISEGTVTITARYKDAYAETVVTIFELKNEIVFSEQSVSIEIGKEKMLSVQYNLLNDGTFEDIVWESSNSDIATVDNGKVLALSEGNAVITASYEDVQTSIEVVVLKNNELKINTEDFVIKEGTLKNIEYEYYFNDGATSSSIVWTSSNSKIASVNNGLVNALSQGQTTITAKYGDVEDSITITVVPKDKITFKNKTLNIVNTTDSYTLDYDFYSYNYSKEDIVWTSSNSDIVSVEDGILSIHSNGQANIVASIGNVSSNIVINVVDPNRIEFIYDTLDLEYRKNTEGDLNIDYYFNDGATIDDIIFESSNYNVARVVNNKIVPTGVGSAIITASYKGVSDTLEVNVKSIDKLEFNNFGCIIGIGQAQQLEYNFDSYEGDYQNITFYSSDENVAFVLNGKVYARNYGTATIYAKYNDITASINVKVTDKSYLLGDVDFDGKITANDASLVLDIYKYGNGTDLQLLVSDLNFDGKITANDAALILDLYKYYK